jgi:hypothetical protein
VKEFLTASVLPVGGVAIAIVALTLTLFAVPPHEIVSVAGTRVTPSTTPIPAPVAATPSARAHVDDALSQMLRAIDDGRRPKDLLAAVPPPGTAPVKPPTAATAAALVQQVAPPELTNADPGLLQATSALGNAVKAIHEARTEEDLVHAEEMVRTAREQMESGCSTSGGPLCQSAAQIRSLGY